MPDGVATGLAWSAPWWAALLLTAWRWRGSPSLDDVAGDVSAPVPRLSVIVPARNEALHIDACVRAILASRYPELELLIVDDHSTDDTGRLARLAAATDARAVVLSPPPLAPGWLGKQWACHHGALAARGDLLLFTDADVRHGPELHARLLGALQLHRADLVSVAGFQETQTFWERVVQPFVFGLLAQWYGGAGAVNRSRNPRRKIANGQCLFFRRDAYDQCGGHESVRGRAAEDLAFAQQMSVAGFTVVLTLGTRHMSTRMYASLGEIVAGWKKNVFAAGRETLPGGIAGRYLSAVLVPAPGVLVLAPVVMLAYALSAGAWPSGVAYGVSAILALVVWFAAIGREFRISPWYALTFPLGALVYLYIALAAVRRGGRVHWKGRDYDVGR